MKRLLFGIVAVLIMGLAVLCLAQESKEEPVKIKVPARTVIPVRLLESLKGDTLAVGQTIDFEVSMDIVIDRYVVIKKGAPAYATVTTAQKAGYVSQGGKLGFSMDHCVAVDGSRVHLKSVIGREAEDQMGANIAASIIICPLFLALRGEEAQLSAGTEFKAYTAEDITVAVLPSAKVPEEAKVAAVQPEAKAAVTERIKLRAEPVKDFSDQDLQNMIKEHNFFNRKLNPGGSFPNDFVDNLDGTVTDKVTGLMWQKAGSPSSLTYEKAGKYVQELNSSRFGGHGDWRLPTMEELCSLLEATANKWGKFIDPVFDPAQESCWSADENKHYIGAQYKAAFCVNFVQGETLAGWAERYPPHHVMTFAQGADHHHVRAVRTADSGK